MSAEIVGFEISDRTARATDGRDRPLVLALPKGRLLGTARPLLAAAGVDPDPDLFDEDSRKLQFETNDPGLTVIRVRSFDTATFLAYGAADLAVAGSDVLLEFDHPGIVAPVDLDIGHCRLSVAEPRELAERDDPRLWSHVRIATKYPNLARRHFAARGVQAECVKLNGALELAPKLGLSPHIVDLVQTGRTLKENGLVEVERIIDVSARLAVNRASLRARPRLIEGWIGRFREVLRAA